MVDNALTAQLTSSAIIAYGIERLKNSKLFPFITAETTRLNRLLMVLASGLAAIGIHTQFDSTTGTLVISGLTAATLLHGAWEFLRSSVFTQLLYDAIVKRTEPGLAAGSADAIQPLSPLPQGANK